MKNASMTVNRLRLIIKLQREERVIFITTYHDEGYRNIRCINSAGLSMKFRKEIAKEQVKQEFRTILYIHIHCLNFRRMIKALMNDKCIYRERQIIDFEMG